MTSWGEVLLRGIGFVWAMAFGKWWMAMPGGTDGQAVKTGEDAGQAAKTGEDAGRAANW